MSSAQDNFLVGAAEQARIAQDAARGTAALDSRPSQIRLGVVTTADGGNYTVGVLGSNGSVVYTVPGVRAWGEATFEAGDRVTLAYVGDRPIPFIVGGGGGGSSVSALVAATCRFFSA